MNKKILVAGIAGLGVLLFAGGAKADDYGDLPKPDDETKPAPVPVPNPKPAPSGKNPPNLSGDPLGYNSQMFPGGPYGANGVRQWFINLGYSMVLNNKPVVKIASAKKFQQDYNKVSLANPGAGMGTLLVDGTAGKNTLNAIEVAFAMTKSNNKSWNMIVKAS